MIKERSDLEISRLIGKIKYSESKTYLYKKKYETIEECKLESYIFGSFNKEGYYLIHIHKSNDSILDYKKTFKYNYKGSLIEENNYSLIYGHVRYKFKYNSKGVLIQCDDCHPDIINSNKSKTTYKYDEKGKIIELNNYNMPNEDLDFTIKYERNSKGYLIEKSLYLSDGSLERNYVFKYDSKGNLIEKNKYNYEHGSYEHLQYIYDSQLFLIEKNSYNLDGFLLEKIIYKRDNIGNLIEKISHDSYGKIIEKFNYKYEFDDKNNWIIKFIIQRGKRKKVEIRKIVYYGDKDENDYPDWDSPSYNGIEIQ